MMPTSGTSTSWRTGTARITPRNTQVPSSPNTAATPALPITDRPGARTVVSSIPKVANSVTPVVPGSTNLLRTSICMISPAMPSEAPASSSATVRGARLAASRKAAVPSAPPASNDAGVTSETPTKRLTSVSPASSTPSSAPTQVRRGRTGARAPAAGVARVATCSGGSARDREHVVDHQLRRRDAAEDDVPGDRVQVDDLVLLVGRGAVHDLVVEDGRGGLCALGAGGGVAVDDPEVVGVVLEQELEGDGLAVGGGLDVVDDGRDAEDVVDQPAAGVAPGGFAVRGRERAELAAGDHQAETGAGVRRDGARLLDAGVQLLERGRGLVLGAEHLAEERRVALEGLLERAADAEVDGRRDRVQVLPQPGGAAADD